MGKIRIRQLCSGLITGGCDKLQQTNINVIDLKVEGSMNSSTIKLSENAQMDEVRLGEMYFNDASYCFQSWQSCTGCHPNEARTDGLTDRSQ